MSACLVHMNVCSFCIQRPTRRGCVLTHVIVLHVRVYIHPHAYLCMHVSTHVRVQFLHSEANAKGLCVHLCDCIAWVYSRAHVLCKRARMCMCEWKYVRVRVWKYYTYTQESIQNIYVCTYVCSWVHVLCKHTWICMCL